MSSYICWIKIACHFSPTSKYAKFVFLKSIFCTSIIYCTPQSEECLVSSDRTTSLRSKWCLIGFICVCAFMRACACVFSGLLTLSGVSLYIRYSQKALEETERRMGREQMALVHTSFGWSMGMAWISFLLEVITGLLLLLAVRLVPLTQYEESVAPI